MARKARFTLMELMVVIIIIVILAGVSVAMMNMFFRGQGPRQGATQLVVAFANGKQLADYHVDGALIHDCLAVAGGRLYLCTHSGQLLCLGDRIRSGE